MKDDHHKKNIQNIKDKIASYKSTPKGHPRHKAAQEGIKAAKTALAAYKKPKK
jgi:hypothetical protein